MSVDQNLSRHLSFSSEKSLADYVDMIRRRKKLFAPVAILGMIVSLGLALWLPPIYESTASLFIEKADIPDNLVQSTVTTYAEQRIEELRRRLMTPSSLMGIIDKFNLYPELRDRLPKEAIAERMRNNIRVKMTRSDLIKRSSGRANQNIGFEISFRYRRDPQTTQKAANELAQLFLKMNEKQRREASEGTYKFLAAEVERLEDEADKVNLRLTEFKKKNLGMLPEQIEANNKVADRLDRDIAEVNRQLFDLKRQNVVLQSDLVTMNKYSIMPTLTNELGEKVMSSEGRIEVLKSTYITLLSKYSPQHPKVRKIVNEINRLGGDAQFFGQVDRAYEQLADTERRLADLKEERGYDDPEVLRLQQEAFRLRGRMESLTKPASSLDKASTPGFSRELNPAYSNTQTQLKVNQIEIESLRRKKADLERKRQELEATLVMSPLVEVKYNKLKREYEAAIEKVENVRKKMNTAEMADKLEASKKTERFTLSEAPQVPYSPVKPNRKQIMLLGLMLSLGLAFGLVYLREMSDRSIYNNAVLERVTGAKSLSVIPFLSTEAEETHIRRMLIRRVLKVALLVVAVAIGLMAAHFYVIPLDEVLEKLLGRVA